LSNVQGALGIVQLTRLEENLRKRRERAARYTRALQGARFVKPPVVPEWASPNWQSYAVRVLPEARRTRNQVAQALLDDGVACRPAYMACHVQPVYRAMHPQLSLPETERALAEVIILPLFPQMTDAEQDWVTERLLKAAEG
jgi:dTDP-4-amino-4,6-dideoxygalactose transaminase